MQRVSNRRLRWLAGAAVLVVMAYTVFYKAATGEGGGGGVQSGAMMGSASNGMVGGDRDSHGERECGWGVGVVG